MHLVFHLRPSIGLAMIPLVSLLSVLSVARPAHAAVPNQTARQRAAKTACLAGDFTKGVELLAELYVDSNDPMYIFNQGRCFEQNGRYEEAVSRFREYQRKLADAGSAADPEAEKHIGDCLSLIEIKKASEPKPVEPVVQPVPPSGYPPTPPQPPIGPGPVGTGQRPAHFDAPMPIQKKLGYAAGILGLASLGVCLYMYFNAQDHLDQSRRLGCIDNQCVGEAKSEYENAQNSVIVSNITGIAGGVLVLGGLILVLTTPNPTPHNVAIVPVVGPGTARLAFSATF
jgi:tetratricopeptide (TPR) repeat protein